MPHLGIDGLTAGLLWAAEIICALLSVFWRPTAGLYLLLPLLPLQTIRYRLHGYFLGDQFIDVLLLGVILGLKRLNQPLCPKTPLTTLLCIYIGFTYVSLFRGSLFLGTTLPLWFSDPRVSGWKNYVVDLAVVFFVTFSAVRTKRQIGIMLCMLCLGCLLLTKGFHNVAGGRDYSAFSYSLRDEGPMGFAGVNGLAAFSAQMAIFLIGLLLFGRRIFICVSYLAVIVACGYCLLFALSRGAYAAFLVGVIFLAVVQCRTLFIPLILFLAGWQAMVPQAVQERITMTADSEGGVDSSAGARLTLWQDAMQVFQADPIFGTGFNTYAYGSHFDGLRDTHNVYVKVLVETGIVGLCLFLWIFGRLFKAAFRLFRTAEDRFLRGIGLGFAGMMIAVFISNLFGDRWMYFQITGYTYAIAALVMRAQQLSEATAADSEASESTGCELAYRSA